VYGDEGIRKLLRGVSLRKTIIWFRRLCYATWILHGLKAINSKVSILVLMDVALW